MAGRRHVMVTEQPRVSPTARYTVNQTFALLGISRRTLYRATDAGKIRCGYRKADMRRFYKGCEITRFWIQEM